MSENKKVALGLGKGVLTLIYILVWYGENNGWATGMEEGCPVTAQPAATGARSVLGQLSISAVWLSKVSFFGLL